MIHLYCGDGKGKTTAACGLALRAAGNGMRVLFAQFLKDGSSGELSALSTFRGITVLAPAIHFGWFKGLSDDQKIQLRAHYSSMIRDIADKAAEYDMIALDEAVSAYRYGLFDNEAFLSLLRENRDTKEIILTGREPAPELTGLADYITLMKKEKHPFDLGIKARKGIEY